MFNTLPLFVVIIVIASIASSILILQYVGNSGVSFPIKPNSTNTSQGCAQDAKQCPDGSYVGRIPPSCEFQQCPSISTTTTLTNTVSTITTTKINSGSGSKFPPLPPE